MSLNCEPQGLGEWVSLACRQREDIGGSYIWRNQHSKEQIQEFSILLR
jgi:hypothetical protein